MDGFECKPNRIWVDLGSEFYDRSMILWLHDNGIEMHLTRKDGKPIVAERFIRILKNKICKHATAKSQNVYIYKLDEIVDKYSITNYRTIIMKPADTYIDFNFEKNDKDLEFKVSDHVSISKYTNIFAEDMQKIGSKSFFWLKILRTLYRGHNLKGEKETAKDQSKRV